MAQDGRKKASSEDNAGIQLLLKKYRKKFDSCIRKHFSTYPFSSQLWYPSFYSEEDYKTAEKKFLNYALFGKIKN